MISPCLSKKANEGKDSPLCRRDVDCVAMAVPTWLSNWQGCRAGLNAPLLGWAPLGENRILKVRRGWCHAPDWSVRGGAWGRRRVGQMSAMTPSGDYSGIAGGMFALRVPFPFFCHVESISLGQGPAFRHRSFTMTVTILSVWWHPLSGSSHRHKAQCFRTFAMRLREAGRCHTCQSASECGPESA